MLLIADSGSTKTQWVQLEGRNRKNDIWSAGLNPYFHNSESMEAVLQAELIPFLVADFVKEIHFYGAGCSTENNNAMVSDVLKRFFHKAEVFIYHDILGAGRALFGPEEGIACILGTGCNACYYDGKESHPIVSSLGYLFGDEGAGSNLGKTFMTKYLKNQVPEELRRCFDEKYNFTLEDILNAVYNRPFPNRFLASLSEFLAPNQAHPYVHDLVLYSFNAFFEAQVKQFPGFERQMVSFVGSIAWYYKDILMESIGLNGIRAGKILQCPMDGLIGYHLHQST